MGSLAEVYFKKETLETLIKVLDKKNESGVSITLSINDDSNKYGQNISGFVSQTKEQREEKKEKFYTCNGKVFWTDGKIQIGTKDNESKSAQSPTAPDSAGDDLPF